MRQSIKKLSGAVSARIQARRDADCEIEAMIQSGDAAND